MLQFDVLVHRPLRPVRLLAIAHHALVVPVDLVGRPPVALLPVLLRAAFHLVRFLLQPGQLCD